jgi:hypothetical protein
MNEIVENVTPKRRKYKPAQKPPQPPIRGIEANRNYREKEAALASNCSKFTIRRARENDHLKFYRCGRLILYSGQHLLDWLEAGGKTGKIK